MIWTVIPAIGDTPTRGIHIVDRVRRMTVNFYLRVSAVKSFRKAFRKL
jgi:hypothetical protein